MITIRQAAYAEARAGSGSALRVSAQAGDLVLLITCSQFGHVGKGGLPSGWSHAYSDGSASRSRSGLVAWTWVSSAQTVNLSTWWGGNQNNASRQRGLLLAVSGVAAGSQPATSGWTSTAPTTPPAGIVVAQQHGTAFAPLNEFAVGPSQVIHAGQASTTASWSTLRAVLTDGGSPLTQGTQLATTAWVTIGLTPAHGTAASAAPAAASTSAAAPVSTSPTSGQGQTVGLKVIGAGGKVTSGTEVSVTTPVDIDVSGLMSQSKGWMVAHRGGSDDWPEMSLRAYTECAVRGVEALEFSFSLTSDGVPVGAHNRDLQGVDPSAPATPVSEMTWEQVRQHTTEGEPIIRLDDLVNAYGQNHVLFVDPKYSAAAHTTYLPWLDRERTILKFYGEATWLADIWRAAGFRTWGYLYAPEIQDGRASAWASHWDMIGVPWDAPEQVWSTALGYGPPVLGHICPSQEALNTCLSRGAVGAMCAKIDGVTVS
ncbi:MAG: glycerophosphodiester phosphodiesterase family protein [Actinomyces sp.]|uniref:glycerophosphodiester phosphodiesterase n=1 Tax=Actinomyces sp. TaxID=29317 RepID=UPI0026DAAC16|nr:glycerophosphodiester phosphodiesterase family protein [Actinomyces sp.]MDO4243467.1 glycerophosphodiester phosphodiesterase family protein [Actinomyces sp.]